MNRAGQEPAQDVKRRIVHVCRQVSLDVASARMYLRKQHRDRLVLVAASPAERFCDQAVISLCTTVGMNGDWSGLVDIRCSSLDQTVHTRFWDTPVMQGRSAVPFHDLAQHLRLTLTEREQVVAAAKLGIEGPYVFEHSRWEAPSRLF